MARPVVYLLHFDRPYISANGKGIASHYLGSTNNLRRRLAEHQAGRGARAAGRRPGRGHRLGAGPPVARRPGPRTPAQTPVRARPAVPAVRVKPRRVPVNRDGTISRSLTTDAQKLAAGLMTADQLAEHTALRHGLVTGKPARLAERGPAPADPWAASAAAS